MQIESDVGREFFEAELGDVRRTDRAVSLARALMCRPEQSFPSAFQDASQLEAFYRFVNNEAIEADDLIEAHSGETAERAKKCPWMVVAHDTTRFKFDDGVEREGLGWLRRPKAKKPGRWKQDRGQRGFFGHFGLGVEVSEVVQPLGVLHLETINRTNEGPKRSSKKLSGAQCAKLGDKESDRWMRGVHGCQERLAGACQSVIHVMDREGDIFRIFQELSEHQLGYVIRVNHNRKVLDGIETTSLRESLAAHATTVHLTRSVQLSVRKNSAFPRDNQRHPPRHARQAELSVRATTVNLKPPPYLSSAEPVPMNVVWVHEDSPPSDQKPIEWLLYTSEPIDTPEGLARVIDSYRARWLIEEFFKALKTGCKFEKRQLESYDALLRTLSLLIPVAWKLLQLRWLERSNPDQPAAEVLDPIQVEALRGISRSSLPAEPTLHQALLAIAKLGGHLKRNGPPGWNVLGKGYEELLRAEYVWRAAKRHEAAKM